jgi:beta-galactosidase
MMGVGPGRAALRVFAPLFILCCPAQASSPRETAVFDFDWRFHLGDVPHAEAPMFDDASWRKVDLPHDWSIEGPYDEHAASGGTGGYLPTGIGWYRKAFRIPAEQAGRRVVVRFDGVYQHSTVWINGHQLGFRPYGYSTFQYDITPYASFGPDGNVIAVRVDNSEQPNSRWYSGSGIYRHTWLIMTDRLHADPADIIITTPAVSNESATITVRVRVHNERPTREEVALHLALSAPDGAPGPAVAGASEQPSARTLEAGADGEVGAVLTLPSPRLWSPETPALYRLRVDLSSGGALADSLETAIGLRTAVFDVNRGFLLNGQPVKLRGFCVHQDGGAVGSAVPDALLEHRLALLKEMGCNAIRCSHNPMAPEFYDICDRLGMLVMDEAFDEWTVRKPQLTYGYSDYFRGWFDRDVTDLVRRDRNHPCVIIWNAGNEIGEQGDPTGPAVLRELLAVFRREDPTRPVTVAMDNIFNQNGPAPLAFTDQLDVVGYNYVDRWGTRRETQYSDDRQAYPQRKFVGTEETGVPSVRGQYRFGSLLGVNDSDDVLVLSQGRESALYVPATLRASSLWRFAAVHDYVSGEFIWTGFDYLGESRWPRKMASFAPLDTCCFKKDTFFYYQSLWTERPMLHLLPHWNWPDRVGKVVPVVAYSNCAAVDLQLNGRSLGLKAREFPSEGVTGAWNTYARPKVMATSADLQFVWDVPYEPGELKALGFDRDGHLAAQEVVRTAKQWAKIELTVDHPSLASGRRDVVLVAVRALDADGTLVPSASDEVTFAVKGPARIIGVDNGDPESHESYAGTTRALFSGMAEAVLQSTDEEGTVTVTASVPGLPGAEIALASRK